MSTSSRALQAKMLGGCKHGASSRLTPFAEGGWRPYGYAAHATKVVGGLIDIRLVEQLVLLAHQDVGSLGRVFHRLQPGLTRTPTCGVYCTHLEGMHLPLGKLALAIGAYGP